MKIGVLLDFPPNGGGTHQYIQTLISNSKKLADNNFNLIFFFKDTSWSKLLIKYQATEHFYSENIFFQSFKRIIFKLKMPVKIARFFFKLHPFIRAIKSHSLDYFFFPSQDFWSFIVPFKSVVAVHDLMHLYEKRFNEVGEAREFANRQYLYRNISDFAHSIFVDSELGKEHFKSNYGNRCSIKIQPYCIPEYIENFQLQKKQLMVHGLEKYLIYPAQFWAHKNHIALIEAVKNIKMNFNLNIYFVFTGNKNKNYESIKKIIIDYHLDSNFIFTGYVENEIVANLIYYSHGLVMPTYFGPTNIPPLESLFLSRPTAVSRIYAMPAQLKEEAHYFNPDNIDELSRVIIKMWEGEGVCHPTESFKNSIKNSTFLENFVRNFNELKPKD